MAVNIRGRTSPLDYFPYLLERSSRGISNALAPVRGRTQDNRDLAQLDFKMQREDQQAAAQRQHQLGVMGLDYKLKEQLADRGYRQGVAAGLAQNGINVDPEDPESVAAGMQSFQAQLEEERQLKIDNLNWQRSARTAQMMQRVNDYRRQGIPIPEFDPATVTDEQLQEILFVAAGAAGERTAAQAEDFGKALGQFAAEREAVFADPEATEAAAITTLLRRATGDGTLVYTPDEITINPEVAKELDYKPGEPIRKLLETLNIGAEAIGQQILLEQGMALNQINQRAQGIKDQMSGFQQRHPSQGLISPIMPEPVVSPAGGAAGPVADAAQAFYQAQTQSPAAAATGGSPQVSSFSPSDALNIPLPTVRVAGPTPEPTRAVRSIPFTVPGSLEGPMTVAPPVPAIRRIPPEQLVPRTEREKIESFLQENARRIREGQDPMLRTDYLNMLNQ